MAHARGWPAVLLMAALAVVGSPAGAQHADDDDVACNALCHWWMGTSPGSASPGSASPARTAPARTAPARIWAPPDDDGALAAPAPPAQIAKPPVKARMPTPPKRPAPRTEARTASAPNPAAPPLPAAGPDRDAAAATLLTVVLVVQPQISRVSDLDMKVIGIERGLSVEADAIVAALKRSGAPSVRLTRSARSDVDRLVDGEVQAIVLAVISRKSAGTIKLPSIAGYNVITLPIADRPVPAVSAGR